MRSSLLLVLILILTLPFISCSKQEAVPPSPAVEVAEEVAGVAAEVVAEVAAVNSQQAFEKLAQRSKMEFQIPEGFIYADGQSAIGLDYEAVLLADNVDLEVRLSLRALQDAEVDYEDPHSSKPAPEHIYPLLYTAIVQEIATDPHSASGGFGENALGEFHADWGQMSVLTPKKAYTESYSSMMFLAIHRRAAADAYMVFLFNDYEAVKAQIQSAMTSLRFLDIEPTLGAAADVNAGENPSH
jgi:hypothetical protein